ncbi:O-acetyl-ADP-ribose deacetylase [Phormidium sp. FACHB-1136]|uniref:O-acetyl-ADP-ribose deacetylase n=1 Tax=Phormidium sp. FACHB-1136 TaxID=2692848 RepID=UPI00322050E1
MITPDGLDRILAFMPMFERPPSSLYEVRPDLSMMDPYIYSPEFTQFIQALYRENLVIDFNWVAWKDEANRYFENPTELESADLETLQKLITTHVRADRFNSGHLAQMVENGQILAILKRLAMIRGQMEDCGADIKQRIQVIQGDITHQQVDAIVNAANESLLGGGGVDGAIHRAAGPELLAECRALGGCPTGEAKITQGYDLPAQWVIHTVGPIWQGGHRGEDERLADCYRNSLALAVAHNIRTLAFPAISTGVYGFPLERATGIALAEVKAFLSRSDAVEAVRFVCFGNEAYQIYHAMLSTL